MARGSGDGDDRRSGTSLRRRRKFYKRSLHAPIPLITLPVDGAVRRPVSFKAIELCGAKFSPPTGPRDPRRPTVATGQCTVDGRQIRYCLWPSARVRLFTARRRRPPRDEPAGRERRLMRRAVVRTDPIRPPDAVNAPVVVVLTADCRSSLGGEIQRPPCHCTDCLRYLFGGRAPFAKP
uniref:Uncharacterized protein n=1 Tax=Plectus sambesii TaxID=2011161 RepID=A0A914VSB1_9BILA